MAEKSKAKPWGRILFWEAAAAVALALLLQKGPSTDPWTVRFVYNACFFLTAFPLYALYRHGEAPGILKFLLLPLGLLLRVGLVGSAYFWAAWVLWSLGLTDTLNLLFSRPMLPGILFALLYGAWIGPLWGTSREAQPLADSVKTTAYALFGGCVGFLVGRGLDATLSTRFPDASQRLWVTVILTLLFALVGAWLGGRGGKSKD